MVMQWKTMCQYNIRMLIMLAGAALGLGIQLLAKGNHLKAAQRFMPLHWSVLKPIQLKIPRKKSSRS